MRISLGRHAYLGRILVLQTRIHDPCPQQIIRFGFSRFQYPLPRYLARVKRRRRRDPAAVAAGSGRRGDADAGPKRHAMLVGQCAGPSWGWASLADLRRPKAAGGAAAADDDNAIRPIIAIF